MNASIARKAAIAGALLGALSACSGPGGSGGAEEGGGSALPAYQPVEESGIVQSTLDSPTDRSVHATGSAAPESDESDFASVLADRIGYPLLDRQERELRRDMEGANIRIERVADRLTLTMPQDYVFSFDSLTVNPAPRLDFLTLARSLRRHRSTVIRIVAHSDGVGDPALNRRLTERRAAVLANELTGSGVGAERIEAQGMGDESPVDSNATEEGRKSNRRIEIVISPLAAPVADG